MKLAPLVPKPKPKAGNHPVQRKSKASAVPPVREPEIHDDEESAESLERGAATELQNANPANPLRSPRGRLGRKLEVGDASDPLEHEADAIADRVMRMPAQDPRKEEPSVPSSLTNLALRRACCSTCPDEDEEILREPAAGQRGGWASVDFSTHVHTRLGLGGQPLSSHVRNFLEPRLDVDLGDVRIHADAVAGSLAQRVQARAFTLGQDIFFGPGELQPHARGGMRLLAHEVAHTLQARQPDELRRVHRPIVINHGTDDPLDGIDDVSGEEPEEYIPLDDSFGAAEDRRLAKATNPDVVDKLEQLIALADALKAAVAARDRLDEEATQEHKRLAIARVEAIMATDAKEWHEFGQPFWTGDYTHGVFVHAVELDMASMALEFREWTKRQTAEDPDDVGDAIDRTLKYLVDKGRKGEADGFIAPVEVEEIGKLLPVALERVESRTDADPHALRDLRRLEDAYFGLKRDFQLDLSMWSWTLDRLMELATSKTADEAAVAVDLSIRVLTELTRTQGMLARDFSRTGLRLAIERREHDPDNDSDIIGYFQSLRAMVTRAVVASQVAAETCVDAAMTAPDPAGLLDRVLRLDELLPLQTLDENHQFVALAAVRVTVVAEQATVTKSTLPDPLKSQLHPGQKSVDVIVDYHRNVEVVDRSEIDFSDAALFYSFDPEMSTPALTQSVGEILAIRKAQVGFIKDAVLGPVGARVRQESESTGDESEGAFSPDDVGWIERAIPQFYQLEKDDGASDKEAFQSTIAFLEGYLRAFTVHPQQNIWERDRYLSRTFPRTLAGQLVHDCGVYALRIAFMLNSLQGQLGLSFHFAILPSHLALIIMGADIGVYAVNNDSITEISEKDITTALPQGSSQATEVANPSDAFIGEIAAKAYMPGANMPYLIIELDTITTVSETALEDLYRNVINPRQLFSKDSRVEVDAIGNDGKVKVDLSLEYLAVGGQTADLAKQVRRLKETGAPCAWNLLAPLAFDDSSKRTANPRKHAIVFKVFDGIIDHCLDSSATDPTTISSDGELDGIEDVVEAIMKYCVTPTNAKAERDRLTERRTRISEAVEHNPGALGPGVGVSEKNVDTDKAPWANLDAEISALRNYVSERRQPSKRSKP